MIEPRIIYSTLSKRWFVTTRYRLKKGIDPKSGDDVTYLVAQTKYDVTEQMCKILDAHKHATAKMLRTLGTSRRPARGGRSATRATRG